MNALKVVGFPNRHVIGLLFFQLFSTVFESFGLSLLLPVFDLIQSGKDAATLAADSRLWQILTGAFAIVGLDPTIPILLFTSFVAIVIRQLFVYFRIIYGAQVQFLLIRRLRERAFEAFLHSRLGYVEEEGLGSIVNDLTVEAEAAVECAMAMVRIAGHFVLCAVYLTLLCMLSLPMTLAAILVIGFAALPLVKLMREGRQVGFQLVEANSALLNFVSERLRSIRLIRLSGMGRPEMENMTRRTERQYERYIRGIILRSRTTVIMEPIIVAAAFVFLYLGVNQFQLELGQIGLFLLIVLRLVPVVKEAASVRFSTSITFGSVDRIARRLNGLEAACERDRGQRQFESLKHGVTLENVSFVYEGHKKPALWKVNIHIPRGKITALVGPSGGGKSTLVDLLPRLREPSTGRILFDDCDAAGFDLDSVRSAISYAPQSPQIFDVTPVEHISYGMPDAGIEEVQKAARLAGAHDFISQLPQGYDTRLSEGGARLSGGQRQRLDLARALMGRKTLLILDEPTSQLDAEAESKFREALERIKSETDLTIVIVGHRFATISIADQIVVLKDGKVSDSGTHAQLMKRGGWYAMAYRQQHEARGADVAAL